MPWSHKWLEASIMDSTDIEHSHHCRKFWTALLWHLLFKLSPWNNEPKRTPGHPRVWKQMSEGTTAKQVSSSLLPVRTEVRVFPPSEYKHSLEDCQSTSLLGFCLSPIEGACQGSVCFLKGMWTAPHHRQAQGLAACSLLKGGPPFPSFQVGLEGRLRVDLGTGRSAGVVAAFPSTLSRWMTCQTL